MNRIARILARPSAGVMKFRSGLSEENGGWMGHRSLPTFNRLTVRGRRGVNQQHACIPAGSSSTLVCRPASLPASAARARSTAASAGALPSLWLAHNHDPRPMKAPDRLDTRTTGRPLICPHRGGQRFGRSACPPAVSDGRPAFPCSSFAVETVMECRATVVANLAAKQPY